MDEETEKDTRRLDPNETLFSLFLERENYEQTFWSGISVWKMYNLYSNRNLKLEKHKFLNK